MIYTDRSRIETVEFCPRKRYWQYEFNGHGLEKAGDLKLDARIGTFVHNGIEAALTAPWQIAYSEQGSPVYMRGDLVKIAKWAGDEFIGDCKGVLGASLMSQSEQLTHDITEGGQIVTALVYAWLRLKAPRLLGDGEILAIEKELTVDFEVATVAGSEIVRLMARPDIIWRRHSDGTIFIRNLKTVRQADDRWREKWALDMQTLSEPLAVDQWMAANVEGGQPDDKCGGVIVDGLVTGKITSAKSQFGGLYHHNNQLVYAFRQELPTGAFMYQPAYKYGLQKVAVADCYPGGIIAWVDHLIEHHPAIVDEHIIELPPIIRSEYQIERWKRQVLPREVAIHRHAKQCNVEQLVGEHTELLLDKHFPMHTANGNCLYPGKCPCYNLCWGTAASDPIGAGYVNRTPNHPQEREKVS